MATTRNSRRSPLLGLGLTIALAFGAGCFAESPVVPGDEGTSGGTDSCPVGELTCACGADGSCFESLVCEPDLDRCIRDDCEAGNDGCPCDDKGRCFGGLVCANGLCAPMSPSTTSTTSDSSTMSTSGPSTTNAGMTMTASTTATSMTTVGPTTSTTADTETETDYTGTTETDATSDTEEPVDCEAAGGGDCSVCFGCAADSSGTCESQQTTCDETADCQTVADCFHDRHALGLCLDNCESLASGAAVSAAENLRDCQLNTCTGGCFGINHCN